MCLSTVFTKADNRLYPSGPLVVTHQERALRSRGNKPHIRHEKTAWYFSSSNKLLDAPPMLPGLNFGELYVHEGPNKQKQVWGWSMESCWTSLQVAAPHPYLPDYILHFCSNGEPSWVTKETLRTYLGRIRKAGQQTPGSRPTDLGKCLQTKPRSHETNYSYPQTTE